MVKRSPTAYNFVTKDKELKEKLRLEHPDWTHPQYMAEFGRLWKEGFSSEEKQKYLDQAKEAKENWTPPIEDEDTLEDNTTKTKKPQSAFFHFSSIRRPIIRESNPDIKMTEVSKQIGEEWGKLTDEEKLPYHKLHEEEKEALLKSPILITRKIKKKSKNVSNNLDNNEELNSLLLLVSNLTKEVALMKEQIHSLVKEKLKSESD